MQLPTSLISDFAKLTADSKSKESETKTLYGTISDDGNSVMIDGSPDDVLTPIPNDPYDPKSPLGMASTVGFKRGDRVSLEIKDHRVVITGNITDKSFNSSSTLTYTDKDGNEQTTSITNLDALISARVYANIVGADSIFTQEFAAINGEIENLKATDAVIDGELEATTGKIDTLESKNAIINNSLVAASGRIEKLEGAEADFRTLESDYAEFTSTTTDKLEAGEADIEKLKTDKLDVNTADITYAKIADLDATSADIDDLKADVADVNTLMFGSATGDTIQSSFSNAIIAQLGDAQIKSAMIENVAADKITAGDIITNNVRVKSEDGSLLISDETMQISDETRVRVQIGKDSSGDYSINIWDQNGALMFSKGGITDSAIKEAIIRDDMVSDTANIAAHKLNINSLFEEINDSDSTIKSTRIYLDDEAQTLDVAFKTLTESVDDLGSTITSQGTQITTIQGNINGKIWQQDINTVRDALETETNTLSTKYSELDQKLDGVTATVSSHTSQLATKADNSSLTTVSDKVTSLETDLNGFRTSVSSTYATKSEVSNVETGVDNLITRVANAETKIDQNTDAIALRTTKDELASTLAGYSTTSQMNAAIQLKADNITSIVSSTYATKTALETAQSDIDNIGIDTERAQTTANNAQEIAMSADTLVQQLADSISMLVTDGNGTSLMTQTEGGWTFSTADIRTSINDVSESLNTLTHEFGDTASTVDILQQAVSDLGVIAEYVKITTYEDEPCIELGEGDSDFKLLITNTRIMFMEGSSVPAYINNQSLHIKKAVIEEELQQGEFVWKARSNGNLGLVWKGVTS